MRPMLPDPSPERIVHQLQLPVPFVTRTINRIHRIRAICSCLIPCRSDLRATRENKGALFLTPLRLGRPIDCPALILPYLVGQMITRRRAVKLIGATTASVCLPIGSSRIFAAEGSPLRRAIPSTGEKLPVIGLGSAVTFDVPFNSPKVADITEVITRFVKRGGKVIDSSPSYGNAESLIGQIAGKSGVTDSLFIATKVRARGREAGIAQIEQSLGRFQRRKIDLIQVHNLVDVDAQMSALRESKSKGTIRYTGITYSEPQGFAEIERNMKSQHPDFVQIN